MKTHPMQPLVKDGKEFRFKSNAIVVALLKTGKLNMNDLLALPFTDEDRMQFAQLIGYSLSGYSELPYVTNESLTQAQESIK